MAKSKKNRQKDFQKVKLKVGKKLKKADNVTNTSFKTRAIQISQQLKKGDETQPSTKKKRNINELFTQCRHYSSSVRLEAVNGLNELITAHKGLVIANLSGLLEKVAELFTDKDSVVRKGAIKLLKLFLPQVSEKQMAPFFPLLCAHLCCAMTHIVDDIQVDSLAVLDLLLENFPNLMIYKSNQVLSNFIEQISRQQGQGQTKRSISTNPNSSTSSLKWRSSVLNRLKKFLSAILEFHGHTEGLSQNLKNEIEPTLNLRELTFIPDEVMSVQIFPPYVMKQWEMSGFTLSVDTGKEDSSSGILGGKFPEFATTLLPLMLECWVESAPSKSDQASAGGNLIEGENVGMMYNVLQVTQALWECIYSLPSEENTEIVKLGKYLKDFEQHFMANFPYSVNTRVSKQFKKHNPDIVQVRADMLNLTICDIMTNFIGGNLAYQNQSYDLEWLPLVTKYMSDLLNGTYGKDNIGQSARTMVKILKRLTYGGCHYVGLADIITAVYNRFKTANISSTEKRVYMEYLAENVLEETFTCLDLKREFLQSLPELLPLCAKNNTQMASLIINTLKTASCQKCEELINQEVFARIVKLWFDADVGVTASLTEPDQKILIGLLYSIPNIDLDLAMTLCNLTRSPAFSNQHVCYMIQVLQNRYLKQARTPEETACHLGLLTSVLMGISSIELKRIAGEHSNAGTYPVLGSYVVCQRDWLETTQTQAVDLERHEVTVQMIGSVVQQFLNTEQVLQVMFGCIEKTVKTRQVVPLPVIFRVCKFAESLLSIPDDFSLFVNDLGLSLVSHLVMWDQSANQNTARMVLDLGCSLLMKTVNGPQTVFAAATEFLHNHQESSCEELSVTLKTVVLFLNEKGQQTVKRDATCLQTLTKFRDALLLYSGNYKGKLTQDTEKMLTQFNYLVSCIV